VPSDDDPTSGGISYLNSLIFGEGGEYGDGEWLDRFELGFLSRSSSSSFGTPVSSRFGLDDPPT
jgi:hypothetical protein